MWCCSQGGRQVTTLVATVNNIIFPFLFFLFSIVFFSHRGSPRITKLIEQVDGSAQTLGINIFPDPVDHFGAPWQPFWDFWRSPRWNNRIQKNLLFQKLSEGSNDQGLDMFSDPVSHLGPPGGHFGLCRRWGVPGVAGDERVPPAPLVWYFMPVPT